MPRKNSFTFFLIFVIVLFIILAPQKVVWGGFSWQTVPTAGPTKTATSTLINTPTVISTATNTRTTVAASPSPTASVPAGSTRTAVVINPTSTAFTQASSTLTTVATSKSPEVIASVVVTQKLTLIPSMQTATSAFLKLTASPTYVFSPSPTSVGDSTHPVPKGPPFWLLPLSCSIGLIALIFALRLLLRKSENKT